MCNIVRHIDARPELKQTLFRIMGDVSLRPSARKAFDGIFRTHSGFNTAAHSGSEMAEDAPT